MAADLATLSIRVDAGQAKAELGGLEGALGKVGKVAAALGLTLGAAALFRKFITETSEAQFALAQLEARVKSTGGAAKLAVPQLTAMAEEMQRLTVFSDEAVMSAQSMLLTFTKIKADNFKEALAASANLADAFGSLQGASIQVGKALQGNAGAMTALQKVGIAFTEAEKNVIEGLFATGRASEAQRMILKELEVEFGGAAEAARQTFGGALAGLKNAWGELFEVSKADSAGVIHALNSITAALPAVSSGFAKFVGGVQLLWLDLTIYIQEQVATTERQMAGFLNGIAGLLSVLPGFTNEVASLTAKAAGLRQSAEILDVALVAWRKEQEALITGTGQQTAATITLTAASGELVEALTKEELAARRARIEFAEMHGARVRQARWEAEQAGQRGITERGAEGIASLNAQLAARNQAFEESLRVQGAAAAAALATQLEEEKRIRENFVRQWQETVSRGIANMLTDGLKSWRSFFDALARMAAESMGDLIARYAAKLSDATKGVVTAAAGGFGTGYSVGQAVGGTKGVALGTLSGAAQGAAIGSVIPGVGTAIGAVVGGISGFVGSLFGAGKAAAEAAKRQNELEWAQYRAAMAARVAAEAQRVAIAFAEAAASRDLAVRTLRLGGLTDEAEALALVNRQIAEFAEAVRSGFSMEFLTALGRVQDLERQALAAQQAADAQRELADAQRLAAEAAEEAARRIAEAQQRAADYALRMADATEDLGVRLLRAQGQAEEADRRAFAAGQARELRAAQMEYAAMQREYAKVGTPYSGVNYAGGMGFPIANPNYNAAMAAALSAMLAQSEAYIAELRQVQAAEAGAFATGQSMPGASALLPGSAGSFNTIVSRATAEQGDRMVDELTTSRILLIAIEVNTRETAKRLGGSGLNELLGSALQTSQALAGSSLVS